MSKLAEDVIWNGSFSGNSSVSSWITSGISDWELGDEISGDELGQDFFRVDFFPS